MTIKCLTKILSLGAIGVFTLCGCTRKSDKAPTVAPPVRVAVTVVGADDSLSARNREYSGTVSSSETTLISFSVGGTINALYVAEGDKISKGKTLGKIEAADYVNASNIAEAQLAEARDAYNRLKKLHDADALPDIKWVEMEQKLKQAENAAAIAKRTLGDATLVSPVSGTVNKKLANVGQNVIAGEPIYEIVSSGNLTIDISVPENEIGLFEIGEEATIEFSDSSLPPLEGKVTQKAIVADPLTRGFIVKVSLPSTDGKILPGMIGNVRFSSPVTPDASNPEICLPAEAVQLSADNRNFVWVVKDGKAQQRFVEADRLVVEGVMVKSGLNKGDSVITEGMRKVGTGSLVDPILK